MATVTTPKKARTAAAKTVPPAPPIELKAANRAAIQFKNLGDPTRIRILCMLAIEERNVGQMCAAMGLGQPGVSHHLALMRHGGVVEARRSGKENFYNLTPKGRWLAETARRLMAEDDAGR
jgi:DNA-binding transcriptional ArsR family regulator